VHKKGFATVEQYPWDIPLGPGAVQHATEPRIRTTVRVAREIMQSGKQTSKSEIEIFNMIQSSCAFTAKTLGAEEVLGIFSDGQQRLYPTTRHVLTARHSFNMALE
jgi:hypothetical protein